MTLKEFFIKLRELDGSWIAQGCGNWDVKTDLSFVRRISDNACPIEAMSVDLFGYDLHAGRVKGWGAMECSEKSGTGLSYDDIITIIEASDYKSSPYRKKLLKTVGITHY